MKKVAIITGSASNIGLAIAHRFSRDHLVVGLDRSYTHLLEKTEDGIIAAPCDITDPASAAHAVKLASEYGAISAVVHSAAITGPSQYIRELSLEAFRAVIDVNLTGSFIIMKEAIPYLQASKGAAVLLTSRAGKVGYAGLDVRGMGTKAHYAASKAGVISLVKSLATELAPHGVRVNGLAPGSIEGTMIPKERWPLLAGQIPLGRLGRPEEIAEAAHFLCSEAASYVTGHILDVNGGTLMD